MTAELLYHDLVSLAGDADSGGIYWLRLFSHHEGHVAVVTEVPGNPGASVTNAADNIVSYIATRFHVSTDDLTLFEVWPIGALGSERATTNRVHIGPRFRWSPAERSDIEALVGGRLPDLPTHDALYQRVLGSGGGAIDHLSRPVFEAVPVESLPPPHLLFKCALADRFEEIGHSVPASGSRSEREREIGLRFLASLTANDRQTCRYHHDDWQSIADESVRIIDTFGHQDQDRYVRAAHKSNLPKVERRWLVSLFSDPIVVRPDGYSSGQHRSCALRFSGADRAAIATDDEDLGQEIEVWKYLGGG